VLGEAGLAREEVARLLREGHASEGLGEEYLPA
jgi:hypothetical protein